MTSWMNSRQLMLGSIWICLEHLRYVLVICSLQNTYLSTKYDYFYTLLSCQIFQIYNPAFMSTGI